MLAVGDDGVVAPRDGAGLLLAVRELELVGDGVGLDVDETLRAEVVVVEDRRTADVEDGVAVGVERYEPLAREAEAGVRCPARAPGRPTGPRGPTFSITRAMYSTAYEGSSEMALARGSYGQVASSST